MPLPFFSSVFSSFFPAGMSGAAVAAAAGAAAAILTGLYLLRLRRRRVVVAFAPLWLPAAGQRRSERLARRLRRWLSLLLALLFAGLLLTGAADPRSTAGRRAGRTLLILVDRSASMSAGDGDGAPTRLGQARQVARALATGLGPNDRALVASFASGVGAESGFEDDPAHLEAAVERIAPTEEPADLGRALAFAAAVLRGRPNPTIVLVSDGAFSPDDRARVRGLEGIDVRFAGVGRRADNLAILSFAARRYPADPTSVEAAVTVQSFRDRPSDVVLEITAGAERQPVDRARLHLGPDQRLRHVLPDVAAPNALLQARLVFDGPGPDGPGRGGADDLAADDTAFAVVPGLPHFRVLRIGEPDLFLDGALLSLGDGVEVRRVPARDLEATRAAWPRYDAVIFDGVTPAPAPTRGRYVYLDPHGAQSPFADRGTLRDPIITAAHRTHPLLRHLGLGDVNIAEARRLGLSPGDEAVASALDAPLIVTRAGRDLRIVALAFDVRRSDLPMRSAFPLLLGNALGWLGAEEAAETAGLRTGQTLRLPLPAGRAGAAVTGPDGARRFVPAQGGAVQLPIARAGFYRVDGAAPLAANLADAIESDTRPARALVLGGKTIAPPDPPARKPRREIATVALWAAAALALLEWWSYHRRWTV